VMDSPAKLADARATGLCAERRPIIPLSAIKNLLNVPIETLLYRLQPHPQSRLPGFALGAKGWASGTVVSSLQQLL
jgi:hypothetical protein